MRKEHFRTQNQISLHQSRFSLFNKIQNLEIEKICLELLFDICIFFKLSQRWQQRGTNHTEHLIQKGPVCYHWLSLS